MYFANSPPNSLKFECPILAAFWLSAAKVEQHCSDEVRRCPSITPFRYLRIRNLRRIWRRILAHRRRLPAFLLCLICPPSFTANVLLFMGSKESNTFQVVLSQDVQPQKIR